MSSGTNQERIEQNNLKLVQLKNKADTLPDYQDIEPVYSVSDYKIVSSKISTNNTGLLICSFDNYMAFQSYQNTAYFRIIKFNEDGTTTQLINTAEFGVNNYKLYYVGKSNDNKYYFARMNQWSKNTNVNIPFYVFNPDENTFIQSTFSFRTPNVSYTDIHPIKPGIVGFNYSYIYRFDFNNLTYTLENINNTDLDTNIIALNDTYMMYGDGNYRRIRLRNLNTGVDTILSNDGSPSSPNKKIVSLITADNSKIIYEKNLYYLNANGTIGDLITPNIINSRIQFIWLAGDYYLGSDGLYQFDNSSNTLNKLFSCTTDSMYSGFNSATVIKQNNNYCSLMFELNKDVVIGIKYDGVMYKSVGDIITVTTDKILNNYYAYSADGSALLGTMPNNKELIYTPTTSQQTIPAGYTSGGTIAAVTNTIDNNIQAENIKKDVTILGITGTLETSASSKLNIFMQETEPEIKNGIWLQTDKTFDKIYFDEQVKTLSKENYDTTKEYPNITLDSAEYANALPAIGMGDFVYVFANSKIYKYDSTNRTCESIKSISGNFSGYKNSACLVGTDIFIFKYDTIYKYDTINETLTTESRVSNYNGGVLVSISSTSDYIYLIYETSIYKYDIKNKSISTLSLKLPYTFSNSTYHRMPCVIGDLVYLFGNTNSSNHRKSYVLDLKNEVITQIKDLPVTMNFAISACQVDGYIYVIQGTSNSASSVRYAVKYDIVNDTYTTIALNTRSVYADANYAYLVNGAIVCVSDTNNNIYFDHFTVSYDAIYDYEDNSIVVWDGFGKYKTQLTKSAENQEGKIQTLFYDAYHYTTENGLDDTIPTYYGDGTQWIKFKN